MNKSILSGILLLVASTAIIIFAYYATIIIGKKTNKLLNGKYIQVLEKTTIGLNVNVSILKINQKIYIITMQGKTIQLLDVIEEKDWKFKNKEDNIQLNKEYVNSNISNKLFNKIKREFNSDRYS